MPHKRPLAIGLSALLLAAAAWPTAAEAQPRRRRHGGTVIVRSHFGYGSFFGPFGAFYGWSPYAFGYGPYGFAPYGPYGFAPYGRYGRVYDEASARVQVTPKQTEVYVDGYRAGVADDFDGTFQRLRVRPGGHEITLYLDGHRPVTQRLYFTPGKTQKIKLAMVPLAPGEGPVARPQPPRAPRRPRPRVET